MSDTDSFLQEVSEELRRDKLYRNMRKYGWIGLLLVVIIVGGAAYREYQKSQAAGRDGTGKDEARGRGQPLPSCDPLRHRQAAARTTGTGCPDR